MDRRAALCLVCGIAPALHAGAELSLSVESSGMSQITVVPGDAFIVDLVLTQTTPGAATDHNATVLAMTFSESGLLLTSVAWAAPYETGTITEDSVPLSGDLPVAIDEFTWERPSFAAGIIDISLSNVLFSGTFSEGIIVSLEFIVPEDFAAPEFFITADPDTISNGFDILDAEPGTGLIVTVVPSPAPATLLGSGIACVLTRRRRSDAKHGD